MSEKDPIENYGFIDHFDTDDMSYMVNVKHYCVLSDDEKQAYEVVDGQFLVHMFSLDGFKSFKMFLNEQEFWVSDASEIFIEKDFIEIIGSMIDERSM